MSDAFPTAVYALCLITSIGCAVLLTRRYLQTRLRLLMWSALCFVFLALNNLIVVLDLLVLPDLDLRLPRISSSLAAVCILLFGFIWDGED